MSSWNHALSAALKNYVWSIQPCSWFVVGDGLSAMHISLTMDLCCSRSSTRELKRIVIWVKAAGLSASSILSKSLFGTVCYGVGPGLVMKVIFQRVNIQALNFQLDFGLECRSCTLSIILFLNKIKNKLFINFSTNWYLITRHKIVNSNIKNHPSRYNWNSQVTMYFRVIRACWVPL